MKTTIYHNPRCSKSRQTLGILEEKGVDLEVVEYLKTPLTGRELEEIVSKLGVPAKNIIRTKEEAFKALDVDLDDSKSVIEAIANEPKLLERPIVVRDQKAVIGRPPENVLDLIK